MDLQHELDDDDKAFITEIFFEEVVAKLKRMDARIGTLNCDFAGDQYKTSWAGVAQLVELQPSKLNVASSNLVSRSTSFFLIFKRTSCYKM